MNTTRGRSCCLSKVFFNRFLLRELTVFPHLFTTIFCCISLHVFSNSYELDPGAGEFMIKRLSIPFRVRHHRCWSNKAVAWVLLPCVLAVLVALILAACGFLPSSSS